MITLLVHLRLQAQLTQVGVPLRVYSHADAVSFNQSFMCWSGLMLWYVKDVGWLVQTCLSRWAPSHNRRSNRGLRRLLRQCRTFCTNVKKSSRPEDQLVEILTGPRAAERILSYYPQLCKAANC